jgi:peptidoglycan L-alanyl-D-glutamate endopeptidase CwlK
MSNLVEGYYSLSMDASTDGTFKAVVLSGIQDGELTGKSENNSSAIFSQGYVTVTVRPLTSFGNIFPSPTQYTDVTDINNVIACHSMLFQARSDFKAPNQASLQFGQIINCYYENGSIKNSDFSGMRFSKPDEDVELFEAFVELATIEGVIGAQRAFEEGRPSPLGSALGVAEMFKKPKKKSNQLSHEEKINSLDVKMRPKIRAVLKELTGLGFQPKIYFAWRTLYEQKEIVAAGNSKVNFSFHTAYKDGVPNAYAVDIIDKRWAWGAEAAKNGFWKALGAAGKKQGLYWGGDWTTFQDLAHLQLLPNSKIGQIKKESGLPDSFKIRND